ncbi:hypothetical protein ACFQ2B_33325 [Streptomyces stramineus]
MLLGAFGGGALLGTLLVGRALRRMSSMRLAVLGRAKPGHRLPGADAPAGTGLPGGLPGRGGPPERLVERADGGDTHRGDPRAAAVRHPHRDRGRGLCGGTLGLAAVGTAVESAGLARTFAALALVQACGAVLFLTGAAAASRSKPTTA